MRDAAEPVYRWFDTAARQRLAEQDQEGLARRHQAAPFGPHPDDLSRVLYGFRRAETEGKFLIIGVPGSGWRVARIAGARRSGRVEYEPGTYESVAAAEHAVFLLRLGRAQGPGPS